MAVSIHYQNLQKLAVEIFKVSGGLSPEIVNYFNSESKYLTNWDKGLSFKSLGFIQFLVVQRSIKFLGLKVCGLVPNEMKHLESLGKFRNRIK